MIDVTSKIQWLGDKVLDALLGDIDFRLNQAGAAWLNMSRSLAPKRTGFLASQEGYRVENRTLILIMGAYYDIFTEFGTRNMMPRPHVRPAMDAIGRVFGGSIEMMFNTMHSGPWHGIHAAQGMTVIPRGLTGKQIAHVRQHLVPMNKRLHRGNVKRAKMTVRRFD